MFAKSDSATYRWVGGVNANDVGQSKNITPKSSLRPVSLSCETSEMFFLMLHTFGSPPLQLDITKHIYVIHSLILCSESVIVYRYIFDEKKTL